MKAEHGEPSATFRLWVKEWAHDSRHLTAEAADARIKQKYEGRLPEDHIRVHLDDEGGVVTYCVEVRRYGVRAEWKHREQAEAWAELITQEEGLAPDEIEVVGRGSRREQALRSFGQLLLPADARP